MEEPHHKIIKKSEGHKSKISDFKMSGDVSLGYRSQYTRHSFYYHNNDDGISGDESLGVYVGNGSHVYRYLETIHYSYCNCGVYHRVDKSGDDGIVGYRSQYISHSSSHSCGSRFDVAGRGGYMSQNRHSSSHNPGGCGRL